MDEPIPTIEIPAEITDTLTAVESATNVMAGLSGDACSMFATIGSLLDSAGRALASLAEKAIHAATEMLGNITKMIKGMLSKITDTIGSILGNIAKLGLGIIAVVGGILGSIAGAVGGIMGTIGSVVDGIKGMVGDVFSKLGDLVKGFNLNFCSGVTNIASNLGDMAGSALASVGQFADVGNMANTAVGMAASAATESALGVATNATGALTDTMTSLQSAITDPMSQLEGLLS